MLADFAQMMDHLKRQDAFSHMRIHPAFSHVKSHYFGVFKFGTPLAIFIYGNQNKHNGGLICKLNEYWR